MSTQGLGEFFALLTSQMMFLAEQQRQLAGTAQALTAGISVLLDAQGDREKAVQEIEELARRDQTFELGIQGVLDRFAEKRSNQVPSAPGAPTISLEELAASWKRYLPAAAKSAQSVVGLAEAHQRLAENQEKIQRQLDHLSKTLGTDQLRRLHPD